MLIDPSRAAYDKLQASVSEYRKINPHSRDKRYGEGLTFEDFKTRYDAGTDFRQPTYSGQPMQPLQSASGGLGGQLSSIPGMGLLSSTPGENPYALNNPSNPLNQLNVTPPEIPVSMQQPIPGLGAPPQGIGSLTPTPQQPMTPTMPGNTMPENTMGGINSLSEFGKPPSLGGNNSFGNPFMGNILGGNNSFQPNQQPFKDNQGLNSYIDNMVNGRLKDIFGGIMGSFK